MHGLGVVVTNPSSSIWESIGGAAATIAVGFLAASQQEKILKAAEKTKAAELAARIAAAQAATDAQIAAMQMQQQSALSKTYAGLPLWAWIALPGLGTAAYFFVRSRRGRGRRRR